MPISEHPPCDQMSPAIDGLTPATTMAWNQCWKRSCPLADSSRILSLMLWWFGGDHAPRVSVAMKSRKGRSRSGKVIGRALFTSQRAHARSHSFLRPSVKGWP